MSRIVSAVQSSVGKKIINGLTGLGLILFVILHLAGNLTLFFPDQGRAFDEYAHFLENLGHGMLLPIAEVGLFLLFLAHIVSGIAVSVRNRRARPVGYYQQADAGHTSRKTPSSKTMIYTGLLLMAFVMFHVWQFRITNVRHPSYLQRPPVDTPLATNPNGIAIPAYFDEPPVRDLYGLVHSTFREPIFVVLYCAVMLMLGIHLRHGVWSAFQSIGMNNRRWLPALWVGGFALSVLLALGFFVLPIYIHFYGPQPVGLNQPQSVHGVRK